MQFLNGGAAFALFIPVSNYVLTHRGEKKAELPQEMSFNSASGRICCFLMTYSDPIKDPQCPISPLQLHYAKEELCAPDKQQAQVASDEIWCIWFVIL